MEFKSEALLLQGREKVPLLHSGAELKTTQT